MESTYGRSETEALVPHSLVDPDDRSQLDDRVERPGHLDSRIYPTSSPSSSEGADNGVGGHMRRHRQSCFLCRAFSLEEMGVLRIGWNKYLRRGHQSDSHSGVARAISPFGYHAY